MTGPLNATIHDETKRYLARSLKRCVMFVHPQAGDVRSMRLQKGETIDTFLASPAFRALKAKHGITVVLNDLPIDDAATAYLAHTA